MKAITMFVLALFSSAAFAFSGTLVGERISGSNKFCKYSDGSIVTVPNYDMCPMTN